MRFQKIIREKILSNRILVKNYLFVSILNILSILLPLVTYPYIIGRLGGELYGYIVFSFTIITYIEMIAGWGFSISAVKDVAEYQYVKWRVNEIVSSVLYIRFALCMVLLIGLFFFLVVLNIEYMMLYILFSGHCVATALFPDWFFQGVQELKYVTYFQLICKLSFLVLMFVFIQSESDYLFYPILFSLGSMLGAIYGLWVMFKKYKIQLVKVSMRYLIYRFKRSTSIFYSRIADLIIERSNAIILGTFIGMKEVAYYDLANKIVRLGSFPMMILNQVIYPKVAAERNFRLMRKVINVSTVIVLIIWGVFILLTPLAIDILGNGLMKPTENIAYFLSPLIISNSIIYLQGSPTLVAAGFFKEFNNSMWWSFIIYVLGIAFIFIFGLYTNLYSILIVQLLTSFSLLAARAYYITKLEIFK